MLKKIQAASGIVFLTFVIIHLANTWLAMFGAAAYDSFQAVVRLYYQNLVIESVLLGALLLHIVVGLTRIIREPKRDLTTRAKWHRYAGFFLMIFIGGHIFAVRGPSWFLDVYPGFAGLAFSIDFAPYYFFPYYALLAVAGFYHGLNGMSIGLNRLGWRLPLPDRGIKLATVAASAATVAALLGFYGAWTDVGDPSSSEFAKLVMGLIDEFSS